MLLLVAKQLFFRKDQALAFCLAVKLPFYMRYCAQMKDLILTFIGKCL